MSSKLKVVYRMGNGYRASSTSVAVKNFHIQVNKASAHIRAGDVFSPAEAVTPPKMEGNRVKYLTSAVDWLNQHWSRGNKVVIFRLRRGHRGDKAEYNEFLRMQGLHQGKPKKLVKKPIPPRAGRQVLPRQEGVGNAGNAPIPARRAPVQPIRFVRPPRLRARQAEPVG